MLKWPRPLPLEDERVRLLHEVHLHAASSKDSMYFESVLSISDWGMSLPAKKSRIAGCAGPGNTRIARDVMQPGKEVSIPWGRPENAPG